MLVADWIIHDHLIQYEKYLADRADQGSWNFLFVIELFLDQIGDIFVEGIFLLFTD